MAISKPNIPLPERVRPATFEEVVGQSTLMDENGVFMTGIREGRVHSLIFWGPPGVGKTTLARIIAKTLNYSFYQISAVASGVKEIREILTQAEKQFKFNGQPSVLFIDEIHRFNKAQQDALLHKVEEGVIILIGATTENPSFEVISALLSRTRIYKLEPLTDIEIKNLIERALRKDAWLAKHHIHFEPETFAAIHQYSGGDARKALTLLESAVLYCDAHQIDPVKLDVNLLQKTAGELFPNYDKNGENHYDLISAFIKSVRGSDPDAALYWMARMLQGGEKPEFIARRLIILASEDVGNAEPFALTLANSAFDAVHKIGMPEARIILGQVTTYLASLPKSNAAYKATDAAMEEARRTQHLPVPLHLRNAPTRLMKDMDYGKNYKYAHDYPGHFVQDHYFPEKMKRKKFYQPTEMGKEKLIKDRLNNLWGKGTK